MKNRILWFLWLLCLAFAAVFTGSWIFAIILLLCGLLLVGSVLLSIFCGKKTKISLQFPKAAEQNEIFEGTLTVFNDSVLPVFMGSGNILWENSFTGESGKLPVSFSLGGKGKTSVALQAKSGWCGCICFTLSQWKSADFFGVLLRKHHTQAAASTVIMPYEQHIDFSFLTKEGFDMESFRYSGNRSGDDPGETFDIREYRQGDSIRQIHWKLTGKLDQLMIREKSFPVDDTVLILADAFLEKRDPVVCQTMAEVFSGILCSFMEQGISCQAGVYDSNVNKFYLGKITSLESIENVLYLFLRNKNQTDGPHTIQEYLQQPRDTKFANYIYITGSSNDKEAQLLRSEGEVTVVSCGTYSAQNKGETFTWKYGSPSQDKQENTAKTCPVFCWKLH